MYEVPAAQGLNKYWLADLITHTVRGFVKFEKIQNPRKTRIGQTKPTHPPIQFLIFFGNNGKHENNTKNTTFPKKN